MIYRKRVRLSLENKEFINKLLRLFVSNTICRRNIIRLVDKGIRTNYLKDKNYPYQVQEDKYYMGRSLLLAAEKAYQNAENAPIVRRELIKFSHSFRSKWLKYKPQDEKSEVESSQKFPLFLTISPGKFCNLKCVGCYANSSSATKEKLSFEIVDRIIAEKTECWGSHFTVVSGGEPLLWQDGGKTILDIVKKHPDNFFLMYTNGTLINKEKAKELADLGNITPAISVEGFEKETDARRGKGVHKRILEAMENLREAGVPFGISLTATRENAEIITSEELIRYYWDKGVLYAWIFQLMPIGRATLDLVVTPEQRLKMFRNTQELIRKGYFIADFWNCGAISNGCISAGRPGGYLYIEWNGNVTPCVFNPYAVANINEIYQNGGHLNDVLTKPFMEDIREWQKDYGFQKSAREIKNWILPCPIRDHYSDLRKLIDKDKPIPIDKLAAELLEDEKYKEELIKYDQDLAKTFDPIWKKEYLNSCDNIEIVSNRNQQ